MVKKILLFLFVLTFFIAFGALAQFAGPPGSGVGVNVGSIIVPGSGGSITVGGGATSSVTMLQVIPTAANAFSLKVLDTSGVGTLFSVKPNGVVTIGSGATFSGPAVISGPVQISALAGSNLCLTTDGSGLVATTTCGGGGATSTPASYVTPGAFGAGDYSFPASLSVGTTTAPFGGVLFVNGGMGILNGIPASALDVGGTVTAAAFVGSGVGVTGVTASAAPWSGVSGKPATVAGYGITDIYSWAEQPAKPSYAFSELTGAATDAQVPDNITINTAGTVTAGQFVGGGAGITGVTGTDSTKVSKAGDTMSGALTLPSLTFTGVGGNSGQPIPGSDYRIYQSPGAWTAPYPTLNIAYHTGISIGAYWNYGGTRFFNNTDMATELFSVGNGDNNVRVANNLYVTGTTTAAQFVGGGASLTGVTAIAVPWTGIQGRPTALSAFTNDMGYLTANQTITLSGAVTGSGTTSIPVTMGVNASYPVTAANGNGICFWNDCTNYKIHMGTGAEYAYGPVTGYSIKTNMNSTANRGWVWGVAGLAPVAAISNTGVMQVAGSFTSGSIYSSGNLNVAGKPGPDYYNVNAGSIGVWSSLYGYAGICVANTYGTCTGLNGTVLGITNASAVNNIPNTGTTFFTAGNVAIGKTTAATALDVVGTVKASTGFAGSGAGLTGVTKTHMLSAYEFPVAGGWQTQWDNVIQGPSTALGVTFGDTTIHASDMVPGRIIHLRAYGEFKRVCSCGGTATPISVRLDLGATQYVVMTGQNTSAYNVLQSYIIDMYLSWEGTANRFSSYTQLFINSATGASVGANAISKYAIYQLSPGADSIPKLWIYQSDGSGWLNFRGRAFTMEYLN